MPISYRFSASLIKVFEQCPFRFYCKISDKKKDEVDSSYADAGQVVHKTLEYYYEHCLEFPVDLALNEVRAIFEEHWASYNIQNVKIDKDMYWLSVINGIKLDVKHTHLEYEYSIKRKEFVYIGYADIMNNETHVIGDWKTSNYKKAKVDMYKEQLKKYAYAHWKEFGVIPTAWVFFNKVNKKFTFKFKEETLQKVEDDMIALKKEVDERLKETRFERNPSRNNCFFCPYKSLCSTDYLRTGKSEKYEVIFHLKKHKLLVEAAIPDIVQRKIEKETNYEMKNAFFIKKAMAARGAHFDGIKRLYRRRAFGGETVQGYMHVIHRILKEYAQSKGDVLKLTIKDFRNQEVMEQRHMWDNKRPLNVPFEFYDYQIDAVKALLKYRWGICEIGTGGGKTLIAAECIRQLGTKTLFLIDNKDLLWQTKKEYEEMLGVKCGIVGMGYRDWHYPIVLATIQTISKHVKEYAAELSKINCVIYDETHIIASKSFETVSKYLINTKWRFGFSATAKRDDGNDKVIYAHTGTVVYKKRAGDLIQEGVLVEPEALFYDIEYKIPVAENWQNEYTTGIVENEIRNKTIVEIANKYVEEGKQVMILCKMIKHCEYFEDEIEGSKLIYGKTDDDIRVDVLEDFRNKKFSVLVGNIKIFNKGINIKNLDVLINASGNAGDVLTVQSIGRILRKSPGKKKAYYIDFIDKGEYLRKHSASRIESLKNEDYYVKINSWKNI